MEDPRKELCKRRHLLDISVTAVCAAISGAGPRVHMEMFAKSKEEWLRTFLESPRSIPSRDALRQAQGNVFSRLDPERFQDCFTAQTQAMAQLLSGEVAAINGQTVRRSHDHAIGQCLDTGQRHDFGPGQVE